MQRRFAVLNIDVVSRDGSNRSKVNRDNLTAFGVLEIIHDALQGRLNGDNIEIRIVARPMMDE